jgi:hypothetical protein
LKIYGVTRARTPPLAVPFSLRNPAALRRIKNAHKARRKKSGNFGRFAFYLQVDAGKRV